jgi:leucyl aminopeptidase
VKDILPATRRVGVHQRRATFNARTLQEFDAAIVVCDAATRDESLTGLPDAERWQKLYKRAQRRGAVTLLSARVSANDVPVVVLLFKRDMSAFERLTLAGRGWKELASTQPASLLIVDATGDEGDEPAVEAVVAAALAGSAAMPSYKSKPPARTELKAVEVLSPRQRDLGRTVANDAGNYVARWLTTQPPNRLNSAAYVRALKRLAKQAGFGYTFFGIPQLKRLQAGAFLAVAQANGHEAAGIVRLRYRPAKRSAKRLALVGKGICFDTGGINLKAHKSMYHMHEDMQGSAVALGTLLALRMLEVPYHVDCWLAITENEIGAKAYRPQDVVRASNGVTIQVAHSDAEGRMVLADTLALASREKPDLIVDYATLTGSCITALTERYSGAFTNREALRAKIEAAGRTSGERVWTFPMDDDYDSDLDSPIADVLQCTPDSKGDHILAARFLNRFVPSEIPWIHLDLAASNRSGGLAHIPTDFTGFGVRFTTELLIEHKVLEQEVTK